MLYYTLVIIDDTILYCFNLLEIKYFCNRFSYKYENNITTNCKIFLYYTHDNDSV